MTDWAQVDLWAERQQSVAKAKVKLTGTGWRAFADLVPTMGLREPFRCYAHPDDTRILVRRPCHYAPGKWRAWRVSRRRMRPREVPEHVWKQVLVALDLWLERGCKVMQHPTRIDLPVMP